MEEGRWRRSVSKQQKYPVFLGFLNVNWQIVEVFKCITVLERNIEIYISTSIYTGNPEWSWDEKPEKEDGVKVKKKE